MGRHNERKPANKTSFMLADLRFLFFQLNACFGKIQILLFEFGMKIVFFV